MDDEQKTSAELIAELTALRRQVAIEEATARIREEVLAMRNSEDLDSIIAAVWQAFGALDVDLETCLLTFTDVKRKRRTIRIVAANEWAETYGHTNTLRDIVPGATLIYPLPTESALFARWGVAGAPRTEVLPCGSLPPGYIELLQRDTPEIWGGHFPIEYLQGIGQVIVYFSNGDLHMTRSRDFSEDDQRVGEAFAAILELAYSRALDFQIMEEQAEQARRERAVERVRAEAMAMRKSDDLRNVVAVLYREMNHMGMDTTPSVSIVLFDEDKDQLINYTAGDNPEKFGFSGLGSDWLRYDEDIIAGIIGRDPLHADHKESTQILFDHWKEGRVSELPDKISLSGATRFFKQMGVTDPEGFAKVHMARAAGKQFVSIPFEYGVIGFRQQGRNQAQETIVRELSDALSLGYLRFLDFQKLEAELEKAHELQMGLMPTESPQITGLDVAGRCIPANHVGGDFFQYFQQDGKLSLCLADVTGHAMEAAIPVVMFSGVLKTEMRHGLSVDALFANLNATLHDALDKRTYVCFAMGELDLADRSLRLANSGCPYPLHFRAATGDIAELQVDAYPLGVRAETSYTTINSDLAPDDYVVFCSDGIIEAGNADEEIFGFEQTAETVRAGCAEGLSAEALIDRLMGEVQSFAGDAPQGDDMTCVVLKVVE